MHFHSDSFRERLLEIGRERLFGFSVESRDAKNRWATGDGGHSPSPRCLGWATGDGAAIPLPLHTDGLYPPARPPARTPDDDGCILQAITPTPIEANSDPTRSQTLNPRLWADIVMANIVMAKPKPLLWPI